MNLSGPIPTEVWTAILKLVRNPTPAPLSKPDRSALRQPHLCSAMRVCKLFKAICIPLLYTNIVSDRFDKLLDAADKPSQRYLYKHTKTLLIEYYPKGEEATYLDVFDGMAQWRSIGYSADRYDANDLDMCHSEVAYLGYSLDRLSAKNLQMSNILPSLESVAVSSIYGKDGKQGDAWARYRGENHVTESNVANCTMLFDDFLASGNLRHLCIRDPSGPLSLIPLSKPPCDDDNIPVPMANPRFSTTIHFINDMSLLPITLGHPIRWVSDIAPTADWAEELSRFGGGIRQLTNRRLQATIQCCSHSSIPIMLEIFCSTDYYGKTSFDDSPRVFGLETQNAHHVNPPAIPKRKLSPTVQRMMAYRLGPMLQKFIRERSPGRNNTDSIKWRTSSEIPICAACGSGPPN